MFRQFKEKNKNVLRVKFKSEKLNKYQWIGKWDLFWIENLNL